MGKVEKAKYESRVCVERWKELLLLEEEGELEPRLKL
jgi:hypothetical protein